MDDEKVLNTNGFAIGGYISMEEFNNNLAILHKEGYILTKEQSEKVLKMIEITKQLQAEGKLNIHEMIEKCDEKLIIPKT